MFNLQPNTDNLTPRSGQVMLISVIALGGMVLGATTIAGLLTLYQIRQATDLANSTKAIFAADAGGEHGLYNVFRYIDPPNKPYVADPVFSNDASVVYTCYDSAGVVLPSCTCPDATTPTPVQCAAGEEPGSVKSLGSAGNSRRALLFSAGP